MEVIEYPLLPSICGLCIDVKQRCACNADIADCHNVVITDSSGFVHPQAVRRATVEAAFSVHLPISVSTELEDVSGM